MSAPLAIRDSVHDPYEEDDRVQYRQPSAEGTPLYRVFLYLEGPRLAFVDSVVYHLHRTFSPSRRRVKRSAANQSCRFVIWTWGLFEIRADVTMRDGSTLALRHMLAYDAELDRVTKFTKA